jgi:hypothetical protein
MERRESIRKNATQIFGQLLPAARKKSTTQPTDIVGCGWLHNHKRLVQITHPRLRTAFINLPLDVLDHMCLYFMLQYAMLPMTLG